MGSDGFVTTYSLPELKLICKEDCVDASDAFGQRNFCLTSNGLFVHMRSPSEFTRGSLSEQARMNIRFSVPTKLAVKPVVEMAATPKTPTMESVQTSADKVRNAEFFSRANVIMPFFRMKISLKVSFQNTEPLRVVTKLRSHWSWKC